MMPTSFACPTCQGRWESEEPGPCPFCSAIVAEPIPSATPQDAIQEGRPRVEYWDEYLPPLEGEGWLSVMCAFVALGGFINLWQMFTEIDKAAALREAIQGARMGEDWAGLQ